MPSIARRSYDAARRGLWTDGGRFRPIAAGTPGTGSPPEHDAEPPIPADLTELEDAVCTAARRLGRCGVGIHSYLALRAALTRTYQAHN